MNTEEVTARTVASINEIMAKFDYGHAVDASDTAKLVAEVKRLRANLEAVEWLVRRVLGTLPDLKQMQIEHSKYALRIKTVESVLHKWSGTRSVGLVLSDVSAALRRDV